MRGAAKAIWQPKIATIRALAAPAVARPGRAVPARNLNGSAKRNRFLYETCKCLYGKHLPISQLSRMVQFRTALGRIGQVWAVSYRSVKFRIVRLRFVAFGRVWLRPVAFAPVGGDWKIRFRHHRPDGSVAYEAINPSAKAPATRQAKPSRTGQSGLGEEKTGAPDE